MKKFSTVLGTTAAGALLATMGVGAASASGGQGEAQADSVEALSVAVTSGLDSMRSALADSAAGATAGSTAGAAQAETANIGATTDAQDHGEPTADTTGPGAGSLGTGSVNQAGGVRDYCIGTLLESQDLVNDYGTTIGRVELWYSGDAGGQNCVMTYNYLDGRNHTEAALYSEGREGSYDRKAEDIGAFNSYAGGSYLDGMNGTCVWFYGEVQGNDPTTWRDDATFGSGWVRCG